MNLITVNCVALVPIASLTTELSRRAWKNVDVSIYFNAVVKLEWPSPFEIGCRLIKTTGFRVMLLPSSAKQLREQDKQNCLYRVIAESCSVNSLELERSRCVYAFRTSESPLAHCVQLVAVIAFNDSFNQYAITLLVAYLVLNLSLEAQSLDIQFHLVFRDKVTWSFQPAFLNSVDFIEQHFKSIAFPVMHIDAF
ncbi:hypothetical protein HN011_005736 [Eciton burchellii]|nr:hypothetical protein HN011_005736 [Eciton burchellii]